MKTKPTNLKFPKLPKVERPKDYDAKCALLIDALTNLLSATSEIGADVYMRWIEISEAKEAEGKASGLSLLTYIPKGKQDLRDFAKALKTLPTT